MGGHCFGNKKEFTERIFELQRASRGSVHQSGAERVIRLMCAVSLQALPIERTGMNRYYSIVMNRRIVPVPALFRNGRITKINCWCRIRCWAGKIKDFHRSPTAEKDLTVMDRNGLPCRFSFHIINNDSPLLIALPVNVAKYCTYSTQINIRSKPSLYATNCRTIQLRFFLTHVLYLGVGKS